jgi:hypothetical protein
MAKRALSTGWFSIFTSGALIGAGALFTTDAGAAREAGDHGAAITEAECGKPGLAPCPLQAWMRANVAAPLASNDFALLAASLEKAAQIAPDAGWSSWATSARAGAAAAKKSDVAGVRASCKSCHDAWREKYREKYRARPAPR